MYPHERALVEKLSDKPFALIGVNSDRDLPVIREAIEEKNLNWRSFWDGQDGAIAKAWKIQGYPTVFVFDADGKIHYKSNGLPDLNEIDEKIVSLLAEMGHKDIDIADTH